MTMTVKSKSHFIAPPSEKEAGLAAHSSRLLVAAIGEGETTKLRLIDAKQDITVPVSAIRLLVDILNEMAKGNAVSMIPIHAELTTQEAADFLNVSRPFFVKVLENNEIPYSKVGVRRKVLFKDLLQYQEKSQRLSQQALDELSAQAQVLHQGY